MKNFAKKILKIEFDVLPNFKITVAYLCAVQNLNIIDMSRKRNKTEEEYGPDLPGIGGQKIGRDETGNMERYYKVRHLNQPRDNCRSFVTVPNIALCGVWLEEAGFPIGSYISVKVSKGQLVIVRAEPSEVLDVIKKWELPGRVLWEFVVQSKQIEYMLP
ncbi:MAG: type I toxin-antitoxin system SymE family toxin [Bacteroidetes bacterium]|nr:type I toxin-antitoxin system SymE family toxin [Bacteroidota bacterium]